MSNPSFSSFDLKTLEQLDTTSDCSISIELGLSGIGYCIFHNQEMVAIEWYNTPLSQLEKSIQNSDWLNKDFVSSHICSTTSKTTLVPSVLFSEEHKAKYLPFNHRKVDQLDILTDRIEQIDSFCIYGITKAEQDIISTFFPKSTISHFSTKYINHLLAENKNFKGQKILINVTYNHLYITVLENNFLLFFNIFRYTNEHDCTYFILFTCEQLNLNLETVHLEFSGDVSKDSTLFDLVYTYVRKVDFRKSYQSISPLIDGLENHQHFPLIHQHL